MKKVLSIEGMMCQNCVKHVTHALEDVAGINRVSVSLENKNAIVDCTDSVSDDILRNAVTDAGYEVTEIQKYEG